MIRQVKRLVPKPVKRTLKRGYHVARARADLASLKRDLRARYGPVDDTVHPQDEMFGFIRDFWHWPHHVAPMSSQHDALRTYLISGDLVTTVLEDVLADLGRDLSEVDSFLDFACGYGRLTRLLVHRLDRQKITVSDINPSAVDFVRQTFGVDGFPSTERASDLDHTKQYEVVLSASLFSHLAIEHWSDWLERLYEMVAPGGVLIFSTHGSHARDVIYGEHWRSRLEHKADGFSFLRTNETEGRLAVDYYGSAFVTEEFVAGQVAERSLGTLAAAHPVKLWGSQDVYAIEKPAA